jgi:hypothetical protein
MRILKHTFVLFLLLTMSACGDVTETGNGSEVVENDTQEPVTINALTLLEGAHVSQCVNQPTWSEDWDSFQYVMGYKDENKSIYEVYYAYTEVDCQGEMSLYDAGEGPGSPTDGMEFAYYYEVVDVTDLPETMVVIGSKSNPEDDPFFYRIILFSDEDNSNHKLILPDDLPSDYQELIAIEGMQAFIDDPTSEEAGNVMIAERDDIDF